MAHKKFSDGQSIQSRFCFYQFFVSKPFTHEKYSNPGKVCFWSFSGNKKNYINGLHAFFAILNIFANVVIQLNRKKEKKSKPMAKKDIQLIC